MQITEQYKEKTLQRESDVELKHRKVGKRMKKCPQCEGKGISVCVVCFGDKINPIHKNKLCGFCGGHGETKCIICEGKGELTDDDIFAVDGKLPNYPAKLSRD